MTNKIGSLIIDVEGLSISPEDREILAHPLVGGVILFARNYASREQLNLLCQSIRDSRSSPLIIMVDQEGGRVQRFLHEFTRLPFMAVFGNLYDENPSNACRLAEDCGWVMAIELLSLQIDLSLAPVLDINKGVSSIIGERAFHANPQVVVTLANAFIKGMREAGMQAVGKHFPGHGSVVQDSHLAIPIDHRDLSTIEQDDMLAFTGMIKSGMTAMMAAHIIFPQIDQLPVGFSRVWLQQILRERLGFTGVILTDDLNMEGANISANYADRVCAAKEAGCDFALLCNNRKGVIEVLNHLDHKKYEVNKEKWSLLQGNQHSFSEAYQVNPRWHRTRELLNQTTLGNYHEHH